jgi:MATE family multidrug resistance protein
MDHHTEDSPGSSAPSQVPPTPTDPMPTGWAVPRGLLLLAGPIIASMISRTVMSFVDFVMVSQLGTEAQAAIMPAGVLLFVMVAFGMGLLSVVNTFVSQSLGRNRPADCAAYMWQGLYLALAMGLMILPLWWAVPHLFAWIGHAPRVQSLEVAYVRPGLFHVGPALMSIALAGFFSGIHRPAIDFWSTLIANTFNVIANYLLIFGHFGLPAMGIAGAAWGTVMAVSLQTLILGGWALRPAMQARYQSLRAWAFDWPKTRRMVAIGMPAAFQHVVEIVAFAVFTNLLIGRKVMPGGEVRFDPVQQAANNLTFKLLEVSFMPTVGLGVALSAAVGKAIGQGRAGLARLTVRWAAGFAVVYMSMVGLGYLLFRRDLAELLTDDPQVVHWASRLLILCAIFQFFDAIGIVHSFALRGAGDTRWPAIVMALYACTVFLGGGYLMTRWLPGWGSIGPWTAAAVYIALLGGTFFWRWQAGSWEKIRLFDD